MAQAVSLASTKRLSRDDWLEIRRQGIGSSDAAAVAGLNPYRSPLSVYLDKRGERPEEESTERMQLGILMEPVIAELYHRRTGTHPRRRNAVLAHPDRPWMLANLDYEAKDPVLGWGLVECKNSGYGKQWDEDEAPVMYIIQALHQLEVTGRAYCDLAALIGGAKLVITRVLPDREAIAGLVQIEADFWERVQEERPPEVDGSPDCAQALKIMYPQAAPGSEVILPDTARAVLRDLTTARKVLKACEADVTRCQNEIKALMGDAETAYLAGIEKPVVTWKTSSSTRLDAKRLAAEEPELAARFRSVTESRRFLVKESL